MISRTIKKQIIDQTNIVEVVGEVVNLSKKGSSYFGLCPFHNDNHPSMSVNNEKKLFNCFSCNTKGNVIYFVSRFKNITEDQATIELAKRLGIEISENQSKEAIKQERLLKVMNEASNFYSFYLNNSEEGIKAKEYLNNRGIDEELVKELNIGLSSSEKNYLNLALKNKNCSELDQIELGLVKLNEKDEAYDVFRNRIMFPIENNSGQTVGFSGRIYTNSNQAKYINSSDNAVFHKGQILYHFHKAIPAIREQNKVILFEGFMDVIAGIRAGIKNTVATMGTALTADHIKAILKITRNITLCFDGDEAGINAMKRSSMLLSNYGILPNAIVLPNLLDPDEYLKEFGKESLIKYFKENEKSVYEWLYELAKKEYIPNNLHSTEKFKNDVFDFLKYSKQSVIVEHFIKKLSIDIDITFENLMSELNRTSPDARNDSYENYVEVPQKVETVVAKTKPVVIKRRVYLAFDMLIKHMINSKEKFIEFIDRMGNDLYIDISLANYFEIIKKLEIFYAENDRMDSEDFILLSKELDYGNMSKLYENFAYNILNNVIADINNDEEFKQCLLTIEKCNKELSKTKLFNRAITSKSDEDIKKFENISKENVIIKSKED